MTRLALVLGALIALTSISLASAAPAPVTGTIAVGAGSDLNLGGEVTFDWSIDGHLHGNEDPMIYVGCYQDVNGDNVIDTSLGVNPDIVYGQLDYPDTVFVLGGGSSDWLNIYGGPAECVARLMIYGGQHEGIQSDVLAEVAFSAGG